MRQLIDELYQERIAGANLGDVFTIGDDDVLALNLSSTSGLQKTSGELEIKLHPTGALQCSIDGLSIKTTATGGLDHDATGLFINVAAKGDLVAGTAVDAVAILPIGTANQVLSVGGAGATGLQWSDGVSPTFHDLALTGTLDVAEHSAFGADATVNPVLYIINMDETYTHRTGVRYGHFANIDLNPSDTLTGTTVLLAADFQSEWNGGVDGSVLGYIQGVKGEGNNISNFVAINELTGVYGKARSLGGATVTSAYGVRGDISNDDAFSNEVGNITKGSSFVAGGYTDKGTGAIITRYGLEIEDITGGGLVTNQYGIYCPALAAAGTGNYFIKNISAPSDFGSGSILTTGTLGAAHTTIDVTMTLQSGSITDSSGAITFDNENLTTSGTLGAGAITGTSFIIGGNTLTTTEWAYLDGQDQSVFTTSTPTFAATLFTDKVKFTQVDGNEYIDSLNDAYMDYGATTGHRLLIAGTEQISLIDGVLQPKTTNDIDLGTSSLFYKDIWESGKHYFRDSTIYVWSGTDGWLNFVADVGVEINSLVLNVGEFYSASDLVVDLATAGLILKDTQSPAHYWRVTISILGALVTADLGHTY